MSNQRWNLTQVLDRELHYYHRLVVLARIKHCLLRAGRRPEATHIADVESHLLAHLQMVELTRHDLSLRVGGTAEWADALQKMEAEKIALMRQLRPVRRANRMSAHHGMNHPRPTSRRNRPTRLPVDPVRDSASPRRGVAWGQGVKVSDAHPISRG